MIKSANRIQEMKREELSWTRLKQGPDEEDEVIPETKQDAGELTRLMKETGSHNHNNDEARTKKGRETAGISFTDWTKLKRHLDWIRRIRLM